MVNKLELLEEDYYMSRDYYNELKAEMDIYDMMLLETVEEENKNRDIDCVIDIAFMVRKYFWIVEYDMSDILFASPGLEIAGKLLELIRKDLGEIFMRLTREQKDIVYRMWCEVQGSMEINERCRRLKHVSRVVPVTTHGEFFED